MFGRSGLDDKALLKSVQRRLERTGMRNKVTATMRSGTVTVSGQLQYEKQRIQIIGAVKGVSGVRQVIDQLKSPPKIKRHPAHDAYQHVAPQPEEAAIAAAAEDGAAEQVGSGESQLDATTAAADQ